MGELDEEFGVLVESRRPLPGAERNRLEEIMVEFFRRLVVGRLRDFSNSPTNSASSLWSSSCFSSGTWSGFGIGSTKMVIGASLRRAADSMVPSPTPRAAGIAGERVG